VNVQTISALAAVVGTLILAFAWFLTRQREIGSDLARLYREERDQATRQLDAEHSQRLAAESRIEALRAELREEREQNMRRRDQILSAHAEELTQLRRELRESEDEAARSTKEAARLRRELDQGR
jgi:DNA anti-recombination protein RmuC